MANKNTGRVVQVIGPVLDIRFDSGDLPNLLNAIEIEYEGRVITAEVAQHVGDNVVRCIAMNSTDGLRRGLEAVDTGAPISVPVAATPLSRNFSPLMADAPSRVGMAMKKENSAPALRPTPMRIAPRIVEPEREVPGIRLRHWKQPMSRAVL